MMYWQNDADELNKCVGKVVTEVQISGDDATLKFEDGSSIYLYHDQDCCETVYIESVVGDVLDLVGEVLMVAEVVDGETPNDFEFGYAPESFTWTFYKFRSRKGEIVIRFLGESNGYYSESVSVRYSEGLH